MWSFSQNVRFPKCTVSKENQRDFALIYKHWLYGREYISESGCAASDDQCGLGNEITVEFPLTQKCIDSLGQASTPGFLLDVLCLLNEEFFFDTVDSFLPIAIAVNPNCFPRFVWFAQTSVNF